MLAEIKRKTLPTIAKAVGADARGPHHFVANAPWSVQELRARRLTLVRQALDGRSFVLCIDETGDHKKGKTTEYVSYHYIGNVDKLENGIVSVNAYGILDQITFPWGFRFSVVLADSLYGESSDFVGATENLHLTNVVAIRSNYGAWLPPGQRVHYTNWWPFERVFSNG